jgi:hypothetical protein
MYDMARVASAAFALAVFAFAFAEIYLREIER